MIGVTLWYLCGLAGVFLLWLEDRECFTPRDIAKCATISLTGPLLMLGAVGFWMIVLFTETGEGTWWTKPLCKRDDNETID